MDHPDLTTYSIGLQTVSQVFERCPTVPRGSIRWQQSRVIERLTTTTYASNVIVSSKRQKFDSVFNHQWMTLA